MFSYFILASMLSTPFYAEGLCAGELIRVKDYAVHSLSKVIEVEERGCLDHKWSKGYLVTSTTLNEKYLPFELPKE